MDIDICFVTAVSRLHLVIDDNARMCDKMKYYSDQLPPINCTQIKPFDVFTINVVVLFPVHLQFHWKLCSNNVNYLYFSLCELGYLIP